MMRIMALLAAVLAVGCENEDPDERWLRDLKSPEQSIRSYAAARLGEIRTGPRQSYDLTVGAGPLPMTPREQRIVDALNQMIIDDEDPYGGAHLSAAMALANLRPPGQQPGLVHCVITDMYTVNQCMRAIITMATPDVLAELLPLTLMDRDRGRGQIPVSQHVIFRLRETGAAILPGVRAVIEADEDLALARTVIYELLHSWDSYRAPDGTAEILVRALQSRFAEVRFEALYALEANEFEHERAAVAALVTDPDPNVRTKATAMLEGRLWDPRMEEREVDQR